MRPLLIYPLPSRVESSMEKLRLDWRFGNSEKEVTGYQPMFEGLFKEMYGLDECNLRDYFDVVAIQQNPDYTYGEKIAVVVEKIKDRHSLSESYKIFTE